jgi:uncharacterized membrane protein
MDLQLVDRWREEGVINAEQAARIRRDLERAGANAGGAMLLAAAGLNGVVLFLFTQLYSVDAALHGLLGLWLACVLPLAYATRVRAVSFACGLLVCAWSAAFVFRGLTTFATLDRWAWLAPVLLLAGAGTFALGGLHYAVRGFENVARGIRIAGLQVAIVALFAMTFEPVAAGASLYNRLRDVDASMQVQLTTAAFAVVVVVATIIGRLLPRCREKLTRVEAPVNFVLAATAIVFVTVPMTTAMSALMASVVLVGLVTPVFFVGIQRRDARLMRVGGGTLTLFFAARCALAARLSQGMPIALLLAVGLVAVGFFATSALIQRRPPSPR